MIASPGAEARSRELKPAHSELRLTAQVVTLKTIYEMSLAYVFTPGFERLLYQCHELIGNSAVDQAMVVAEREMDDRANGDGIVAVFVGNHHGLLGDATHAHDGGVRLIDDGQAKHSAELAGIGDREGRAFHVRGHELLIAGALAEIRDATLQGEEVQFVGIL